MPFKGHSLSDDVTWGLVGKYQRTIFYGLTVPLMIMLCFFLFLEYRELRYDTKELVVRK